MYAKQFALLVLVAFVGGVVGGIVSHRLTSIAPALATGFTQAVKIEADVVEAREFRVVDDRGWVLTRLYYHEGSKPAGASLDFIDGRPGRKNKLHLSIEKDSIRMLDENGDVGWSAP